MTARTALAALVVLLAACTATEERERAVARVSAAEATRPEGHPRGALVDCSMRSIADFPDAFESPSNLVVGPLALVGGAGPTADATVLAHDGQKYPLLVKAGHVVTLELPRDARATAGLSYGRDRPQGRLRLRDAHDTITFIACRRGDGGPFTFWSGVVMTAFPDCVPLNVYVDDEPAPRRAVVPLRSRPCDAAGG